MRFEENIELTLTSKRIIENNCWVFTGYIDELGYGQIRWNNTLYRVHRLSFLVFKGAIPSTLTVNHICSNRKCFNPEHLELATRSQQEIHKRISNANIVYPNKKIIRKPRTIKLDEELIIWIETHSNKVNDCWDYKGKKSTTGYANIGCNGKSYRLHRLLACIKNNWDYNDKSWEAAHLCKNRWCVNPSHIEKLSIDEHRRLDRQKSKNTILSIEEVKEIKQMHLEGNCFNTLGKWDEHIASIYNVSSGCIQHIRLGTRWGDINV